MNLKVLSILLLATFTEAGAQEVDLFARVAEAKELLDKVSISNGMVLIAVLSPEGNVETFTIPESKRKGSGRANSISPQGFRVKWKRMNGLNTGFQIEKPVGYKVLAIKRKLRKPQGDVRYAVYVPYTDTLAQAEFALEGIAYSIENVFEVRDELRELKVESNAVPGKLVIDVIPAEASFILPIIEHMDPDRFQREPTSKLINEVLAILGANKETAYRYAVSHKASARGLHQFIRSSYSFVCNLVPEANLLPDFVAGMNDHVNAGKAAVLLMDSDLKRLHDLGRMVAPEDLEIYLAAAYNGGATNAINALDSAGHLRIEKLKRKETRTYVRKYLKVRGLMSLHLAVLNVKAEDQRM